MNQKRVRVVLLGVDQWSTFLLYGALRSTVDIINVVLEPSVSRRELVRRRVKRLGLGIALGQVLFGFARPLLRLEAQGRRHELMAELDSLAARPDKRICTRAMRIDSAATIELLRRSAPDAVLVNGTRILSRAVLESVQAPFVNAHAGITPCFRGVHGAYWALATGHPELCGVTVHLVDSGIDSGGVLAQALIQPTPRDNFTTYPLLQLREAIPLLREVFGRVTEGRIETVSPLCRDSRLWSHPTLWGYLRRRWRGVR